MAIHEDILVNANGLPHLNRRYEYGALGRAASTGAARRPLSSPASAFPDEATSHLDLACEAVINTAIWQLDITRIIVDHWLETIRYATLRVLVLSREGAAIRDS